MKLLISAFDPFGGQKINPSSEALKLIRDKILDIDIVKVEVPTVFYESIKVLKASIDKEKPDFVICLGQAAGSEEIRIERVAINIDDARIKDNKGNQPIDEKVFIDGENAYFSNLPIKAMVNNIRNIGIKASVSNSAGTFVCNHLLYGLLYYINKEYKDIKGTFIHIPSIEEDIAINGKFMPLNKIVEAIEEAIRTISLVKEDIKKTEGKEF